MSDNIKTIVSTFIRGESFDLQYAIFLDQYKSIISKLNTVLKDKDGKDLPNTMKEVVLISVLVELKKRITDKKIIDRVIDGLKYNSLLDQEGSLYKKDLYFLEYYIFRVFMKDEVNIYIFPDSVEISDVNDFLMNNLVSKFPSYITINLNNILAKLYNKEDLMVYKDSVVNLTENEIEVLEQIRMNDKKIDMNISFKDGYIFDEINVKEPLTKEDLEDLDEVANDKDFGTFEDLSFHRGKITSGKVIKRKRFDKQ